MLRIGQFPDYAVLVATILVDAERLLTTDDLVQRSKLPLATVRKLLKRLVDADLVISHRGNMGGYELAYKAKHISIADVLQAVDGPISLVACDQKDNICLINTTCQLADKWHRVNELVLKQLQAISLEDMARNK